MDSEITTNVDLMPTHHAEGSQYKSKQGELKIFFGYAAGVGKTYAMLEAAHEAKKAGVDVAIGYIEPHARPQTLELVNGLEQIPVLEIKYKDIALKEFDTDAAIKRHPQLILVDELAHTNAKGSRHIKRFQDVQELLRSGIDVYTTLNVQHIESINDIVESITGISVNERIPDSVFNSANQVELIDIEPDDLIKRLKQGKIYKNAQAQKALENFFNKDNLIALREIALRRTADRVNLSVEKNKLLSANEYLTDEHVLICLSSSPSNAKVIRTAARIADAFHCDFTALFVETSSFEDMSQKDHARLQEHMQLANQLGAKLVTVYGDDVPQLVAEYAKASSASKILIGRPAGYESLLKGGNFVDKLTVLSPNLEILIVPNKLNEKRKLGHHFSVPKFTVIDTAKTFALLAISTLIGFWFYALNFSESNIITVYILGVLITAVVTEGKIYSGVSSILAVLTFNYFFTEPRFSFEAYNPGYPLTFVVMFISAFLTSTLTKRATQQARISSQKAYRTEVLLETSQKLQRATGKEQIFNDTAQQIMKLLDRTVVLYPVTNDRLDQPVIIDVDVEQGSDTSMAYLSQNEQAVAEWVYRNNKHAGAGTNTLPDANCLYMAIRSKDTVFAVVGVAMKDGPKMDAYEKNLLVAMLAECALAIEKENTLEANNKIVMQANQEQLQANLLRAISHDLRTPLTGISGDASLLMKSDPSLDEATKQRLYVDIYDDSMWLINLVENLLSISRIENGTSSLKLVPELIEEIINEALSHINRKGIEHQISVDIPNDMLMAKVDACLIVQVLINIVNNAIEHTQAGSHICITALQKNNMIEISVADDGDGIPDDAKLKLFDMFYTAEHFSTDSRRGLGLGLALCKSIILAHGGDIYVKDGVPKGTVIYFTLKANEAVLRQSHLMDTFQDEEGAG